MLRVGITGGIGSGKTVVRRLFEREGFRALSADKIARDISNRNKTVRRKIAGLLGSDAYGSGGSLDRTMVAQRVFGHRAKERALNAIIHPYVLKEIRDRFRVLERRGERVAFVEAALIFEAGMDVDLDFVIVVDARRVVRTARVMMRDGATKRSIEKRMAAQWPSNQRKRRAHVVLQNDGTLRQLRSKVKFLASLLLTLQDSHA